MKLSGPLLGLISVMSMSSSQAVSIIAHRGYSAKFPENTLEALEAAVPHAQGIEFDIHCTRDSYLVLHHDATWDRMTLNGNGVIAETNWIGYGDQLKTKRREEYSGPELGVTLLETVLSYLEELDANPSKIGSGLAGKASDQPFIVIIDIKEDQPIAVLSLLAEQLNRHPILLNSSRIQLHVGVWAEDFWQEATRVLPAQCLRTWINEGPVIKHFGQDVDSYDVELNTLSLLQVHMLRQQSSHSAKIFVWTCNVPKQIQVAKSFGVDGILADDPILAANS